MGYYGQDYKEAEMSGSDGVIKKSEATHQHWQLCCPVLCSIRARLISDVFQVDVEVRTPGMAAVHEIPALLMQ
jgi:hypothetical protein